LAIKVKGRTVHFAPWSAPEAALKMYPAQKDDLFAGREVRNEDGLAVGALVNDFLASSS
jgi:hypothetical protein